MNHLKRSRSQFFLLALSLLGIGITIYLTSVHYENVPLICSESGLVNCNRVISSSYSVVPGTTLPITIPGLAWCVVVASLAIAGLITASTKWQRRIRWAQFIWALSGMLVVLYLVYAEIVLLHTICAWCTALHVLILLMFLITLVQLQFMPSEATVRDETEFEDTENVSALPRSKQFFHFVTFTVSISHVAGLDGISNMLPDQWGQLQRPSIPQFIVSSLAQNGTVAALDYMCLEQWKWVTT